MSEEIETIKTYSLNDPAGWITTAIPSPASSVEIPVEIPYEIIKDIHECMPIIGTWE